MAHQAHLCRNGRDPCWHCLFVSSHAQQLGCCDSQPRPIRFRLIMLAHALVHGYHSSVRHTVAELRLLPILPAVQEDFDRNGRIMVHRQVHLPQHARHRSQQPAEKALRIFFVQRLSMLVPHSRKHMPVGTCMYRIRTLHDFCLCTLPSSALYLTLYTG